METLKENLDETPFQTAGPFLHIGCMPNAINIKKLYQNDLGETQFLIDGEIKGILPKPNRMLGFDADLLHRATTFRDKHRFTIAIKYS